MTREQIRYDNTSNTSNTHNEPPIDVLAEQWLCVKALITSNMAELRRIEDRMLPFLDQKEEGTVTTVTKFGRKICVNNRLNYTLDGAKLMKVRHQIPKNLLPLRAKEVLDETRLRFLRNNEPETYKIIAHAISAKPGKATLTIKVNDDD
jgi:hypothetical protein